MLAFPRDVADFTVSPPTDLSQLGDRTLYIHPVSATKVENVPVRSSEFNVATRCEEARPEVAPYVNLDLLDRLPRLTTRGDRLGFGNLDEERLIWTTGEVATPERSVSACRRTASSCSPLATDPSH